MGWSAGWTVTSWGNWRWLWDEGKSWVPISIEHPGDPIGKIYSHLSLWLQIPQRSASYYHMSIVVLFVHHNPYFCRECQILVL